jgi:hypothetical protein
MGKRKKSTEKAIVLWPYLIEKAKKGETVTYAEVRDYLEYPNCLPVIPALWNITWHCEENRFPPLTSIVVSQKTGKPSSGFTDVMNEDLSIMQKKVFSFNWSKLAPEW